QIEAQHILLTDEELAEKVAKEAQDDGDFAKLAEKYSTDEENAKEGGELPHFGVGEMTPAFEEAVYAMDEGEIIDPVQSGFRLHIIKINKKEETDEDFGDFEDQEEQIRSNITTSKIDQTEAMEKISNSMEEDEIAIKVQQSAVLFA